MIFNLFIFSIPQILWDGSRAPLDPCMPSLCDFNSHEFYNDGINLEDELNIHLKIYITNESPLYEMLKRIQIQTKYRLQCNPPIYISRGKHNAGDVNSELWRRIWDFLSIF